MVYVVVEVWFVDDVVVVWLVLVYESWVELDVEWVW